MEYNDDRNFNNDESIFEDSSSTQDRMESLKADLKEIPVENNSVITKFFDSIAVKLQDNKLKKLQNEAEEMFKDTSSFLELLCNFGCFLEYNKDFIEISCKNIDKKGKILISKKKEIEFDDGAKEILSHIATLINRTDALHDIINKYEQQGFYPVGELEKENAIINGKECVVLTGVLENDRHEQKRIYYYNGQELFLGN